MPTKARFFLAAGLLAGAFAGLYPPWIYVFDQLAADAQQPVERPGGFALLFRPPEPEVKPYPFAGSRKFDVAGARREGYSDQEILDYLFGLEATDESSIRRFQAMSSVRLDVSRLFVEWIILAAATSAALILTGDARRAQPPIRSGTPHQG